MVTVPPELAEAYRACERMARAHYENFPVASLLLPAEMRPHVAALYAFARTADDFADEGSRPPEEREALLEDWGRKLDEAVSAERGQSHFSGETGGGSVTVPLLAAAAHSIRQLDLPVQLFHDLLSAFRQDVRVKRYATWDDLLDYCRRSANPVGRLVLRIGGYSSSELDRRSDAVCTALQLTNFWQDLERDWNNGRLYVPADELAVARAREADLTERRWTPEWRAALARVAARTRSLFDEGRPIADRVRGRLGWELRLTWLGGVRILDSLERRGFNVFAGRPALSAADAPGLLWQALTWTSRSRTQGPSFPEARA